MASNIESGMDVILQRRLRAYELALDTARRDAVAAAQTLSKLTARIGELELSLSDARERPQRLEAQLSESKRARRTAEQRAYAERVQREELEAQLAELERGREQAVETLEELAAAEARHVELEEEVRILRRRIDEADHLAAASVSARERAEERVAELSEELHALRDQGLGTPMTDSLQSEMELADRPTGTIKPLQFVPIPPDSYAEELELERELVADEPDGPTAAADPSTGRLSEVLRALRPELSALSSMLERERAARIAAEARAEDLEQRLTAHLERANRAFAMIEQIRGALPASALAAVTGAPAAPAKLEPTAETELEAPEPELEAPEPELEAPEREPAVDPEPVTEPELVTAPQSAPEPVTAPQPAPEPVTEPEPVADSSEMAEPVSLSDAIVPASNAINPERLAEALRRLRAVTGAALDAATDSGVLSVPDPVAAAPDTLAPAAAAETPALPEVPLAAPAALVSAAPGATTVPPGATTAPPAVADPVPAASAEPADDETPVAPEPASAEPDENAEAAAATTLRPWLRSTFSRLVRYDPDAAGRLIFALLPLQEMAYANRVVYDIGSAGHYVHVSVDRDGQRTEVSGSARPSGNVDFAVEADPVGLAQLLSAGSMRRRFGLGLPKVRGDRRQLAALDALLAVPLFAGDLHEAGVDLGPVLAMKLAGAMIGRDPTNGKSFTLGFRSPDADPTGPAEVALLINGPQRPEIVLDVEAPTTTIVCEPEAILAALTDAPDTTYKRIGARDPLNWVQRRMKVAQST